MSKAKRNKQRKPEESGLFSEIGENLLLFLYEIGRGLPVPFESPFQHQKRMLRQTDEVFGLKQWQYNQVVKNYIRGGKIRILEKGTQKQLVLTKQGKLKALFLLMQKPVKAKKKWDGCWRLMVWDIPEDSRRQRDIIRDFAKANGFAQLQQSVFIRPDPLPQPAVDYIKETGLTDFIRFLRVDKMDKEEDLKKYFDLK